MRLLASSASISTTALTASCAFLRIGSASHVAKIVGLVYDRESLKESVGGDSHNINEECSFAASFNLRGIETDVGILSTCSDLDYICVEDESSVLGGRCVPDVLVHRNRNLQDVPATCNEKCTPASACEGLSQEFIDNNIGERSCCGDQACQGVSETSKIGAGSCVGYKNCYKLANAIIGDNSCVGDSIEGPEGYTGFVCSFGIGTIGNWSCWEYAACYQDSTDQEKYSWNVDTYSCHNEFSCAYSSNIKIGEGSCLYDRSCYEVYIDIPYQSCNGDHACYESRGPIDAASCNGYYACYKNLGSIGSESCNAKLACENNSGNIGSRICNTEEECKKNSSTLSSAPTSAPTLPMTSPPSTKPSTSPTKNPTTAPTKEGDTLSPTKKPVPKPTKKPSTKTPTARPVSMAPTKSPVKISPTLVLAVDLCYPGCGDFTEIYTDNEFEDIIMKYTPCSPDECTVNIIDESDSCTSCSIDSSRRLRFLQDTEFQSSAITFEIVSDTPLNEQVVINNLDTNITASNDELSQDGVTFRVASNYTQGTIAPTVKPTKKPSKHPSPKSSKSSSKSTKEEKPGKSSKPGPGKPKSGKKSGKATNKKKQDMKKKHEEGAKRKGHFHHIVVGGSV